MISIYLKKQILRKNLCIGIVSFVFFLASGKTSFASDSFAISLEYKVLEILTHADQARRVLNYPINTELLKTESTNRTKSIRIDLSDTKMKFVKEAQFSSETGQLWDAEDQNRDLDNLTKEVVLVDVEKEEQFSTFYQKSNYWNPKENKYAQTIRKKQILSPLQTRHGKQCPNKLYNVKNPHSSALRMPCFLLLDIEKERYKPTQHKLTIELPTKQSKGGAYSIVSHECVFYESPHFPINELTHGRCIKFFGNTPIILVHDSRVHSLMGGDEESLTRTRLTKLDLFPEFEAGEFDFENNALCGTIGSPSRRWKKC